jgi:alpha-N-arabinofuranosidase
MSDEMDRFIRSTVAACDFARAKLKKNKRIMLSFEEWNVWFHSHGSNGNSPDWSFARPILEDVYTMEDALLVGSLLSR